MDKRVEANRNTRLRIIRATVRLLGEKKLSDISVTDIVEAAGVARASYYRNFDSKEGVLMEAGRMIIDDFKKSMQGVKNGCCSYDGVLKTFRYFLSYREPLLSFHRTGCTSIYEGLFQNYIEEEARKSDAGAAAHHRASFFSGALFSVYVAWLEGGMEESPEDMARMFCAMAASAFGESR